ncbi:LysR family transcriptional regulator [Herbaspirillum sp. RTI4]|uniref:LysR family transcriptional regulator n=1 Tax=Herbaspirillum sp. RTI4 TaxID=3048640 RepID=UPI002AB33703|nr:LysR family transcriptional regulator [Herbaspirillum sp. RTI4]MDY7576990.1 LysR family transcriptional regulator [Herbaspirillum sp. RTI4]MEA9982107.1 LysR family transcriptional regulator [Herbaspirillum sp. RTI4]
MAIHFDLVDMRLFVNIAEENSLTRGAERTHMSVPSASTRIKNVEESLGTKLLYRTNQGVTLTPPGQAMLHHAKVVLQQLENMRGDLQEYTQGIKGHVRIFANTTSITESLPEVLRIFLSENPDVNVDLKEKWSHDSVRAVTEGAADIGIIAGDARTEGLEVLPYRSEALVLAVAATNPLAERSGIDFNDTLDHNYICLPEGSAIHIFLTKEAQKLNKQLKIRIQVGSVEAVCRMIEANIGIGVVPEFAARRHARNMAIRIIPLDDEWAMRHSMICVRSLALLPAFTRKLVDMLVNEKKNLPA